MPHIPSREPEIEKTTPPAETPPVERERRGGANAGKKQTFRAGDSAGRPARATAIRRSGAGRMGVSKKQKRIHLIIGGVLVLLVVSIFLAALIPGCSRAVAAPSSSSGADSSLIMESGYNQSANALPTDELVGTILPETEDAGEKYVEETLFLGDSNTARMLNYGNVTGVSLANGIGIEGMGIQSVTSLKCVRFQGLGDITMPAAVKVMQPRRIVITFGTNNVGTQTETFINWYKAALDAIHEAYPYADIIIGSVFPIDQYHMNQSITMTAIDKYNLALAELAEEEGYKFLNWSEAMRDTRTGFSKTEYTVNDGIHLSKAGMEAIFKYFRTHSYITEDTRPKPLKAIPQRLATPPHLIIGDSSKGTNNSASSSSVVDSSSSEVPSSILPSSEAEPSSVVPPVSSAAPPAQPVTVTVSSSGGGSVSPSGSFAQEPGTSVTVSAAPDSGYVFVGWSVSGGTPSGDPSSPTLMVLLPSTPGATVNVVANFTLAEPPTTTPLEGEGG